MTLQNRVTPFGELVADPARGAMMGNRGGMFHDPKTRTLRGRRWASRRWLCCSLDYPGSHRHPVWSRGYTQLFFLDEVTALAAGHRPCAECRRAAADAFRRASPGAEGSSLVALDERLHRDRLDGSVQRRHRVAAADLPDGAVLLHDGHPLAIRGEVALPWGMRGYGRALPRPRGPVDVLTPALTVAALERGYSPVWHASAR